MAVERTQGRTFDLERLLVGVESGKVVLPEFQRDFRWAPSDIISLLATVLAGWPLGSLLVLPISGKAKFATRGFVGTSARINAEEWIVLDGQQRLTSLYQALYGRGDNIYSVRLDLNPGDPIEGLEQAIEATPRDKWSKRYPTPASQFESSRVPVYVLREAADFFEWRDAATASLDERESLSRLYRNTLAGLQTYTVPAVVIDQSLPVQAIARVFERVNRQGLPLSTFDLMVAITYGENFNLKTQWSRIQDDYPRMVAFLEGDGLPLLTLLALRKSRDIRQKAVLELDPEYVSNELHFAAEAMQRAVDYCQRNLGALRVSALPYPAMLQVVAGLAREGRLEAMSAYIQEWFWNAAFSMRYAVAANTRIVSDFESITSGEFKVPRRLDVQRDELLLSSRRRNAGVHRTLMCAAAVSGLRDMLSGDPLEYEDVDVATFVECSLAPRSTQLHTRTLSMVWADPSVKRTIEANASACAVSALEVQQALAFSEEVTNWDDSLSARADSLLESIELMTGIHIELVDEAAIDPS